MNLENEDAVGNSVKTGSGRSLWLVLGELPRDFWVLFIGTFINRFGSFVMPFLAIYLTGEGYTAGQAGLAIAAYGAGGLIASLVGGHLADTIGRRHTMALGSWAARPACPIKNGARRFARVFLRSILSKWSF